MVTITLLGYVTRARNRSVDASANKRIWKFILGLQLLDSAKADYDGQRWFSPIAFILILHAANSSCMSAVCTKHFTSAHNVWYESLCVSGH
jgi:hypothetical protein